jgi:hypothetical protein
MIDEGVLIATLLTRDGFIKYRQHLKEFTMLPETWEIIKDLEGFYKAHPSSDVVDLTAFIMWVRVQHPTRTGSARAAYETQIEHAFNSEPDTSVIERLEELTTAIEVKELCQEAIDKGSTGSLLTAASMIDKYREHVAKGGHDDPLAEYDLADVFESLSRTGGWSWRIPELNKAIGPICKGDFILVGKRPEVGGTTFLTSEFTHMLSQMPDDANVVIFNNEEEKARVVARAMQSALGMTVMDMACDWDDTANQYRAFLGTRTLDIVQSTSMTTAFCDSVLKRKQYDLIGFNVLWKVRPWGRELDDYQLYQRVAMWARGVANQYAPVVGIWQADASAEGVEYLDQSQLFGSKTGVQGEADVQMMIGSTHEPGRQFERYFNVVKNKVPASAGTDPHWRHGKFVVDIEPEIGRFIGRIK